MSHRDDETMSEIMNGFMSKFDDTAFKAEWTHDGHVAEDSVYAWLDGALDATETDAVQAHVSTCAACSESVAEARGYIAASTRIMHAADVTSRRVLADDDVARAAARIVAMADATTTRPKRVRAASAQKHLWHQSSLLRAAAVLLLAVGVYSVARDADQLPTVVQPASVADSAAPTETQSGESARSAQPPATALRSTPLNRGTSVDSPRVAAAARRAPGVRIRQRDMAPTDLQGRVASAEPPVSKPLPSVNVEAPAPPAMQRALGFTTAQMSAADVLEGRTMSGIVRDENGQPVEQAFVRVAGVEGQVLTAADGSFTLKNVRPTASVVQVRRLGYEAVDVRLDTLRAGLLDVHLTRAVLALDGVAITGISGKVAGVAPVRCTEERHTLAGFVNSAAAGPYTPLVTAIRIREPYSRKNDAVLEGWPDIKSTIKLKLIEDNESSLSGLVARGGVRLELQLSRNDDGWIGIVREYRGPNVRSENLQYRRDSVKRCN